MVTGSAPSVWAGELGPGDGVSSDQDAELDALMLGFAEGHEDEGVADIGADDAGGSEEDDDVGEEDDEEFAEERYDNLLMVRTASEVAGVAQARQQISGVEFYVTDWHRVWAAQHL